MNKIKFKAYQFTGEEDNKERIIRKKIQSFFGKKILPRDSRHISYIVKYFSKNDNKDFLVATHIVFEYPYLSRSFLYDYTNYYSYTHGNLSKDCVRIHFFGLRTTESLISSAEFQKLFDTALLEPSEENSSLWDNYLGYVVVKPILGLPIGPIVVKPYPDVLDNQPYMRKFLATKKYHINFGGTKLEINTLAMQSQDRNVSACATASIWSAFQKLSKLFKTPLPSPYEITEAASEQSKMSGRLFPNEGLTLEECIAAIAKYNLTCTHFETGFLSKAHNLFIGCVYAYMRLGIPLLLMLKYERANTTKESNESEKSEEMHMVTITGYREFSHVKHTSLKVPSFAINLESDHITDLYVHDDNVGPFLSLTYDFDNNLSVNLGFKSEHQQFSAITVDSLLVPLRAKFRINFQDVYEIALQINKFVSLYMFKIDNDQQSIFWDIHLNYSNDYKQDMLAQHWLNPFQQEAQKAIVLTPLPKYIWVLAASIRTTTKVESEYEHFSDLQFHILIDPTGIRGALNIMHFAVFNADIEALLKENGPNIVKYTKEKLNINISNNEQMLLSFLRYLKSYSKQKRKHEKR